jgi:hypothetical protein
VKSEIRFAESAKGEHSKERQVATSDFLGLRSIPMCGLAGLAPRSSRRKDNDMESTLIIPQSIVEWIQLICTVLGILVGQ